MKNIIHNIRTWFNNLSLSKNYREDWLNNVRRKGFIKQHSLKSIEESLDGLFQFSDIKFGDIKKGQGDVVIVNLRPMQDFVGFQEYFSHTHDVGRIETKGIYTNIFWGKKFFEHVINEILA